MTKRIKQLISLLLMLVFLAPSMVKLEHHHDERFICTMKDMVHFHAHHDDCQICAFEFSVFTPADEIIDFPQKNCLCQYRTPFFEEYFYKSPEYSFSLRAPPTQQILNS